MKSGNLLRKDELVLLIALFLHFCLFVCLFGVFRLFSFCSCLIVINAYMVKNKKVFTRYIPIMQSKNLTNVVG